MMGPQQQHIQQQQQDCSYMEVPILFPPLERDAAPLYVINDVSETIRPASAVTAAASVDNNSNNISGPGRFSSFAVDASITLLRGAASVSSLSLYQGTTATITTGLLPDQPWILSVSLFVHCGTDADAEPRTIHLDLGSQTKVYDYKNTVKVQAFSLGNSMIRLVLADSNGVLLQLTLHAQAQQDAQTSLFLVPVSVQCLQLESLLGPDRAALVAPSSIRTAQQVAFLSPHCVLVAMHPFLVAVHLVQDDCTNNDNSMGKEEDDEEEEQQHGAVQSRISVWSYGQCLEAMKARSSGSSVVETVYNYLVGKTPNKYEGRMIVDMDPVSALTVLEQDESGYEEATPTVVFTLHSDGTVRQWTVLPSCSSSSGSCFPHAVVVLNGVRDKLPSPETWSDGSSAVGSTATASLVARLYNREHDYALAISIQVQKRNNSAEDEGNNSGSNDAACCCLWMVHGPAFEIPTSADAAALGDDYPCEPTGMLRLQVPAGADSLLGMAFDTTSSTIVMDHNNSNQRYCSMLALFESTSPSAQGSSGGCSSSILVRYPRSFTAMIDREPVVQNVDLSLDYAAHQERSRIVHLDGLNAGTAAPLLQLSLPDALDKMDTFFLRYIFRPILPRGTGSVVPPSAHAIRRALHKLVQLYNDNNDTTTTSIELEVLAALHEWRHHDNRRNASTPTTSRSRINTSTGHTPTSPSILALATTTTLAATPGTSLYESLAPMQEEENEDETEYSYYEDEDEVKEENMLDRDREEQVKAHENRWKRLLLAIWDEEAMERVPLCLACTQEQALVLRSAVTCALIKVESPPSSTTPPAVLSSFDQCALQLLSAIQCDPATALQLAQLEQQFSELVSRADLAMTRSNDGFPKEWARQIEQLARSKQAVVAERLASDASLLELRDAAEYDLLEAFEQTPVAVRDLAGLCFLKSIAVSTAGQQQSSAPGRQLRLAASSLTVRSLDSARRLLLARSLLLPLAQLGTSLDLLTDTTARMYLHTVAALWTSAQHVPIPPPTTALPIMMQAPSLSLPSPHKRPSIGNGVSSILNVPDKTSALDAHLLQLGNRYAPNGLLREHQKEVQGSPLSCSVVSLGMAAAADCLRFTPAPVLMNDDEDGLDSYLRLPELGLLAPDAAHHPRLALRLLAPAMALPQPDEEPDLFVRRSELVAECLLKSTHFELDADRAKTMADRAFGLLAFDASDLPKSMERLNTVNGLVGENQMLVTLLLEYIEKAIEKMECARPQDVLQTNHVFIKLWSTLFNVALVIEEWEKAVNSCLQRSTDFRRLIRAMVDAGAMAELLQLCSKDSAASIEAFANGFNLYEIAAETLGSTGFRDSYQFRVTETATPLSDYHGALYALHASQGEWRKAAQALDLVHGNAMNALRNGPSSNELVFEKAQEREGLIVDDLLLSSLGCHLAVTLVDDESSRFIVSGEHGSCSSLAENSPTKRLRVLPKASGHADHENEKSPSRYMNLNDLEVRAAITSVLSTLFNDESVEPTAAKSALLGDHKTGDNIEEEIIVPLFSQGYYQALIVAIAISRANEGKPKGCSAFHISLNLLLCDYLVPLAIDLAHTPPRPAMQQLNQALGYLSREKTNGLPPILVGSRSKKASALPLASIRLGAMSLLHSICVRFSSADMPLAVEVAECFFTVAPNACLPTWLENLLLHGADGGDAPGLFARRPKPGSRSFLGDPCALLSIYRKNGMYSDACRIVTALLDGPDADSRKEHAPQRLAEKGDVDFVPYGMIDSLWACIEVALLKGIFKGAEEQELKASRKRMEEALENHFSLLKISEIGQTSARALASLGHM